MFTVDRNSKRTFDSETGSELYCDQTFRDGTRNFSIECSDGKIQFSASSQQKFDGDGGRCTILWHVRHPFYVSGEVKSYIATKIIEDALTAYKQLNGLPQDARVEIKYVNEGEA
ncbi:hypothetical protein [Sphingobium sp. Sx8-8]|uniref:hypothetical protein n=1 Tax=Sphingobium sp. Sx8-8 TaxID=2933617 RepID=UPI001F59042C|nr:hypothetical protein [Sphingobium sp. Sx8-8]